MLNCTDKRAGPKCAHRNSKSVGIGDSDRNIYTGMHLNIGKSTE